MCSLSHSSITEVQSGSGTLHGFKVFPTMVQEKRTWDVISHFNMPVVVKLESPPCQHIEFSQSICREVSIGDVKLNHDKRILI